MAWARPMMVLAGALGLGFQMATSMAALAAAASAEPGRADALVVVEDFAFTPSTVTVHAGGSVVWSVRKDPEQHTVTPVEPGAFEGSGQLFAGDDYTIRFDSAGRFEYICALHPFMTGTVVVQAAIPPTAATPSSPLPVNTEPGALGSTASATPADEPIDPAAGSAPALAIAMLLLALGVGLAAFLALQKRPR